MKPCKVDESRTKWLEIFILCAAAVVLRIALLRHGYGKLIGEQIGIATPATDYTRVLEGRFLANQGLTPYDSDTVHMPPLLLSLLWALESLSPAATHIVYIAVDLLIGWLMIRINKMHTALLLADESRQYPNMPKEVAIQSEPAMSSASVAFLTLFNPCLVASCVAQSTVVFHNLAVVAALYWALRGKMGASTLSLALAIYQSFYPLAFVVPVSLVLARKTNQGFSLPRGIASACLVLTWLGALLWLSFLMIGSWSFVDAVYTFLVTVADGTPNVGLCWYFIMEIFNHFRSFFLWVFQLHVFLYVVPVCVRLRHTPTLAFTVLVGLTTVFKTYPSVGDLGLFLTMATLWHHLAKYMRHIFLVAQLYLVSATLGPLLYWLWISSGAGNANFFFAMTLIYSAASVLLAMDLMQAHLRRSYDAVHGLYVATPNTAVVLQ